MATESRNILKSYFKTGKYPTEGQFAKLIDSFVHKNDQIGMSSIEGLAEALNGKADKATIDLKDYAEAGKVLPLGGCYVYYGMPTHARTLNALDTDFDPEATEGDTTQVVVFCCGHSDGDNSGKGGLYLVYGSTNNGYAYYARFNRRTVPEDIQRAFGEAVATTSADGLMSAADKQKLDGMRIIDILDYKAQGKVLPIAAGCTYYIGTMPVCIDEYILPTDSSGNIVDDERSQRNNVFYVVRSHRQFIPQEVFVIFVWKHDGSFYGEYEYQTAPAALSRAMNGIQYIPLESYIQTNSKLPLGNQYIYTYNGLRVSLDLLEIIVNDRNKIVLPPPDASLQSVRTAEFWVFKYHKGQGLPEGTPSYYVWHTNGNFYGDLSVAEDESIEIAYERNWATQDYHGLMSAEDKKKLDAIKPLDINNYCRSNGRLPQDIGNYNVFLKSGTPLEMRQWDSNSQKFMAFATLSIGDVEEKALGTAPMEYRQSYYVFRDDDNGYYEYLTAYGYSNVPMNIARAFHGEEMSEAVDDIFSI